ncbi:MAG: carboxypeptidase regulatory-like domain-containing protein [Bacteroidota bacterium]
MRIVTSALFFFFALAAIAQDHGDYDFTPNQSRADQLFERKYFGRALDVYKAVIKRKKNASDPYLQLKIAACYQNMGQVEEALAWYQKASFDEATSDQYFDYAEVLAANGKYEEAGRWYRDYLAFGSDPIAEKRLASIENLDQLFRDSTFFDVVNLSFNSEQKDFSPFFDGEKIVFVSSRKRPIIDEFKHRYHLDESLFLNLYQSADPLVDPEVSYFFKKQLSTAFHEGPGVIFDEGLQMYFTRNNVKSGHALQTDEEGYTRLKLFHAQRKSASSTWNKPQELPFNSADFSSGHPAILENGNTVIFVSDRPGGFGEADLYITTKSGENWSEPRNLGPAVNTAAKEMFPFVTASGDKLFFASEGHGGLGGLDIFESDIIGNEVSAPRNLGHPVNSSRDDFGLIYEDSTGIGYFASNRPGGRGDDDIYYFIYSKPREVLLRGIVVDADTQEPIPNATVNLSGDRQTQTSSGPVGEFEFKVTWDQQYDLLATKAGYSRDSTSADTYGSVAVVDGIVLELKKELILISGVVYDVETTEPLDSSKIIVTNIMTGKKFGFVTRSDGFYQFIGEPDVQYGFKTKKYKYFTEVGAVSTMGIRSGTIERDFELEPIVIGKPIRLGNIYFDLAKWDITSRAATELDKFVATLQDNPAIIVELGSHTDCRGSDPYNLNLSQQRASSSADYIVTQGIGRNRIEAKGYGETVLTNECDDGVACTEEQHEVNRRSEFKVLGFLPDEETEEELSLLWLDPNQLSSQLLSESDAQPVKLVNAEVQKGSHVVVGLVTDEATGAPIASAKVFLKLAKTNLVFETLTDGQGNYRFEEIPNGQYELIGARDGYGEAGMRATLNNAKEEWSFNLEMAKSPNGTQ